MTENEAIKFLKGMQNKKVDYAEMVCAPSFCYGYEFVYPEPEDYAILEAIKALEEVQEYRKLGTMEEVREAVEKEKVRTMIESEYKGIKFFQCPECDEMLNGKERYCPECGCRLESEE